MTENNLVFHVRLNLKPECVAEWRGLLDEVIKQMSREETFIACFLNQSAEDGDQYTLFEVWSEPTVEEFVQNQMSKRYRAEYENRLASFLKTPRATEISKNLTRHFTFDRNERIASNSQSG